ncbi:MAG: Imm27 family immunity protein [Bacteroidales bacterium]|nr:Imm27 family immunity protein [Bacteroidales bacterium]
MGQIKEEEFELRGNWIFNGSTIDADNVCKRIENLISEYLTEIAVDESGWEKLYQDPADKRYWELIYTESEMQGGGPPMLRNLSKFEVKKKYGNVW